ncbi:hypothetical protein P7C73_g2392, partial [Tremellales sp. Uapishka_1]
MPVQKKKGAIFAIWSDSPASTSSSSSSRPAASPTKRPPRKALAPIQPLALNPTISQPSSQSKSLKPSVNPKLSTATKSSSTLQRPPLPKNPSRRQIDIFSSPAPATTISTPKRTNQPEKNKENVPPPDSPAARTRSKTSASSSPLLGDGRGTLTLKKGRILGEMCREKKGRSFEVLADSPLSDVSEAYGASGIEPEGFRD